MQAVQFTGHGGTEVVEYGDYPDPDVGADEVLVDVKAGALNHVDVWTRRGLPGLDLEHPHVPGSDGAGVVREVGDAVTRFEPGDRVALLSAAFCGECEFCRRGEHSLCESFHIVGEHVQGVHSELAAIPEENLVGVPGHVDWETAAAAPLVFGTAWRMVTTRGGVSQGDAVLVIGASGGVGHAAVQIAAHAGAEVVATASTDEKLAAVGALGADHVVDYTEADVVDRVADLTDGRGVDVAIDHVGAETYDAALRSLAKGGRLVTCGATTGADPDADLRRIFWNQLSVVGSTMASLGEFDDVLELVWDGTFEPAVRETLPMSKSARGHQLLEDREGVGKVVVVPDSEW